MNRRRIRPPALVLLALTASLTGARVQARPVRVSQIPNGSINRCASCHLNATGGGPRNPFGTQIETGFLDVPGAAGSVQWQAALAALDADGDGASNGQELQDPGGAWRSGQPSPGNPAAVTNPGIAEARAVPAAGPLALSLGALALVGLTALARRRRG